MTLDAENRANKIFIFQFWGAFSAAANSSINLINGASASNIFWIAEGAVSMGAQIFMQGTIISNNGAVSMGDGGVLEGRMLSTTGAINSYNGTINSPGANIALGVSLLSFTSYHDGRNTILQWKTASETNNSHFTIDRSQDGKKWDTVERVKGGGNSPFPLNYSLTDSDYLVGTTYYRLKQTDFDGSYNYESIITSNTFESKNEDHFIVYPNPSEGIFNLSFDGNSEVVSSIDIFNSAGQNVSHLSGFQSRFDLSNNIPGFYIIQIEFNSEIKRLKFVLSN